MHNSNCSFKLYELAEKFKLQLRGDGEALVEGVGTLTGATDRQISFLSNPAYRRYLEDTAAAAVIVSAEDAGNCPVNALIASDPYVSYAKIAELFDPRRPQDPGVHVSASIDPSATIGKDVHVGANAVIGPGCRIGDACSIGPGCVLTADCQLGSGSRLVANVTLLDGVRIGKRTLIHPGAVIGADGFGLAFDRDQWIKVPQLGSVQIGNDCEIGANTTIDRGAIGDTIVGNDVRLDNQIQIGHNVKLGAHTAMAGRSGIAGSTEVGEYCLFGGASGAVGHLRIADRTTINFSSVVTKSITEPGTTWSGLLPAQPQRQWNRMGARLKNLEKLAKQLRDIERQSRAKKENTEK